MELIDYIANAEQRRRLASEVGTSPQYLWQIAARWRGRRPSRVMALAIERATNGAVTRHTLRPDKFGLTPDASASDEEAA